MSLEAQRFLDRLQRATNEHDLEAVVRCFSAEYINESPAHPSRGFVGNAQVRENWRQIFAFVPDITVKVLAQVMSGAEIWSEWEMRGTRRDGTAHLMCGVIIFAVRQEKAVRARFYLEPVDDTSGDVGQAVRSQVHADAAVES